MSNPVVLIKKNEGVPDPPALIQEKPKFSVRLAAPRRWGR